MARKRLFAMSKTVFPVKMCPAYQLIYGAMVVGAPSQKVDSEGIQKKVGDLYQWEIQVAVTYGPKGAYRRPEKVTVLAASRPSVADGQIVRFLDLHVGAWSNEKGSGLYFWATRAEVVEKARGDQ